MKCGTSVQAHHTVGFDHEQNRPDRDNYLTLYLNNVTPEQQHNFTPTPGGRTWTGKNRLTDPYDKKGMTPSDAYQVKQFYAGVC